MSDRSRQYLMVIWIMFGAVLIVFALPPPKVLAAGGFSEVSKLWLLAPLAASFVCFLPWIRWKEARHG